MDGWSPIVATASDNDRSSSEGEYMAEAACENDTGEAADGEQRSNVDGVDDGNTAAVGFGISGTGEGKVVLGRVGQRDDKELRYLHLLWEPGRAAAAGGVTSKLGKMTASRARRQHRVVRNFCPIGTDIYGETLLGQLLTWGQTGCVVNDGYVLVTYAFLCVYIYV